MNKYFLILLFTLLTSSTISAEPTRIMLLGDSITFDYRFADNTNPRPLSQRSGYRNYLWYKLKAAKFDVDFVGRQHAGSAIRPVFDIDHEGYSGLTSQQIADGIAPAIQILAPHIVILHIGTNDYSTSVTGVENILKNIDTLEKRYNFPITIIVARIINKTNYSSIVATFNRNLQRMLDRRIASGDDLVVVDMEHDAGLHYDTRDFSDLLHPNNSGYSKMADVWFKAISKVIPPSTPSNLKPSFLGSHTVTLEWKDNANNEKGFKIYRGAVLIATLNANTTSYILNNLESNKTYTYTIVAYSSNGKNSKGQKITFTTKDDYAYLIPAVYSLLLN